MPTGYTAAIADGITFSQFALSCARAMGACILMRDDPSDAPIPDEFKPSDYYEKQLSESANRLAILKAMTMEECDAEAKSAYEAGTKMHMEGVAKESALREKYELMLAEVEDYTPPSSDHEGFKKFMRDQIIESIRFDCGGTYHQGALEKLRALSGNEWLKAASDELLDIITRAAKSQKEENERCSARSKWVRQLRESLKIKN